MPYKYIELIIIIAVTFLVLNKLFKILGQVEDNDVMANKVKNPPKNVDDFTLDAVSIPNYNINQELMRQYVYTESQDEIYEKINELSLRAKGKFDLVKFMDSLTKAISMILSAAMNKNAAILEMLVDKRFIMQFQSLLEDNKVKLAGLDGYVIKIFDVYFFANQAFITIAILNENQIIEKWTFSQNTQIYSNKWFLSNIDNI